MRILFFSSMDLLSLRCLNENVFLKNTFFAVLALTELPIDILEFY